MALFSESQSRLVVTVAEADVESFEKALDGCAVTKLGTVTDDSSFKVKGFDGAAMDVPLAELKEAWQKPLRW